MGVPKSRAEENLRPHDSAPDFLDKALAPRVPVTQPQPLGRSAMVAEAPNRSTLRWPYCPALRISQFSKLPLDWPRHESFQHSCLAPSASFVIEAAQGCFSLLLPPSGRLTRRVGNRMWSLVPAFSPARKPNWAVPLGIAKPPTTPETPRTGGWFSVRSPQLIISEHHSLF